MISSLMVATLLAAFLSGGVPGLAAVLKPGLAKQLQSEPGRIDRLLRCLPAAWIFAMPLAGWMIDNWGAHGVLFFGYLGIATALGILAIGVQVFGAVLNMALLALSSAMVTVAAASLMPQAIVLRERNFPAGSFGVGYTAVAFGYLTTTWLWPRLEARFGYRQAMLGLGLACLFPAALLTLVPFDASTHPHSFWAQWSGDPRLWLVGLAVFLYFSLEQVLDVWTRPFLAELGYQGRTAAYLMTVFWVAFLLTRVSAGWIMRPGYEGWFLLTFMLISSMVIGNLAGAYAPSSGVTGFLLVGASYGPLLPTFFTVVYAIFKDSAPGTALGVMYGLAAINFLFFRPWFVAYAQSHPVRAAMRIPMLMGLVMAAATLVLTLIQHQMP